MLIFECSYPDLVRGDVETMLSTPFRHKGVLEANLTLGPGEWTQGKYPNYTTKQWNNAWRAPFADQYNWLRCRGGEAIPRPMAISQRVLDGNDPRVFILVSGIFSNRTMWLIDILIATHSKGDVVYQDIMDALKPKVEDGTLSSVLSSSIGWDKDDFLFAVRYQAVPAMGQLDTTFYAMKDEDHLLYGYIVDPRPLGQTELIYKAEARATGSEPVEVPFIRGELSELYAVPSSENPGGMISLEALGARYYGYLHLTLQGIIMPFAISYFQSTVPCYAILTEPLDDHPVQQAPPGPVDPFIDELKLALLAAGGITALIGALQTAKQFKEYLGREKYIPGV